MAAKLKTWEAFFDLVANKNADPSSDAYAVGVREAKVAIKKAESLREAYRPKAGNKNFSPVNGEINFHLRAFRHGFNQLIAERTAKPKKSADQVPTGGLFVDALDKSSTVKYDAAALRRNKEMLEAGKQFAGVVLAAEGVEREQILLGFRDTLDSYTADAYPPIAPQTPATSSSSSSAASSSSSSSSSSEPEEEAPPELKLSLPGRAYEFKVKREMRKPSKKAPKGTPPTLKTFQENALRMFAKRSAVEGAPKTVFGVLKEQAKALYVKDYALRTEALVIDIIKVERYKVVEQLTNGDYAFVVGYGAGEVAHAMRQTAINEIHAAADYAKVRDDDEVELPEDYVPPSVEGILDKENDISTIFEMLSVEDGVRIFDMAFEGAINAYFATWKSSTKRIREDELLDPTNTILGKDEVRSARRQSPLLEKLAPAQITVDLFAAWAEVNNIPLPEQPAEAKLGQLIEKYSKTPVYFAFSHFADVGILAGVEFLRIFVRNSSESASGAMSYPLWLQSFLWYVQGFLAYTGNLPLVPTKHVQSMNAKRTYVGASKFEGSSEAAPRSRLTLADMANLVITRDAAFVPLGERATGRVLHLLDPDYVFFRKMVELKGTAADIMFTLIDEGFPVDPETSRVVADIPDSARATWEMRVLQSALVFSFSSRVMRPWVNDDVDVEAFRRNLVNASAEELGFYTLLGRFSSTFDVTLLAQIVAEFEGRLPPALRRGNDNPEYVKCALIVDQQVAAWFERSRLLFDEKRFDDNAWQLMQRLWNIDDRPVAKNSYLYQAIKSAYVRQIELEKATFLRRRAILAALDHPTDLAYAERNYLMLTELLAMVFKLHSAFTVEVAGAIERVHAIALAGDEIDEASAEQADEALSFLLGKLWPERGDRNWLDEDDRVALVQRVDDVELSDANFAFFDSKYEKVGVTDVAKSTSLATLADNREILTDLLLSAYLAEMHSNCNIIFDAFVERDWETALALGDVFALKSQLVTATPEKKNTHEIAPLYKAFIQALEKEDVAGGASVVADDEEGELIKSDEDEEDEDGEDEEDVDEDTPKTNPNFVRDAKDFMSGLHVYDDDPILLMDDKPSRPASSTPVSATPSSAETVYTPAVTKKKKPAPPPAAETVYTPAVTKKAKPVPTRSAPEPATPPEPKRQAVVEPPAPIVVELYDISSVTGPLQQIVVDAASITRRSVMFDADYVFFQTGQKAGESFAHDLTLFVTRNYKPVQYSAKYSSVRAYALSQLSNIYEELSRPVIGDAIWDQDSTNMIVHEHEVEIVRKLLTVTGPVAQRIFSFEGKKPVYMAGFIHGYGEIARESIVHFEEQDRVRGGGRKELLGDDINGNAYQDGVALGEQVYEQISAHAASKRITYEQAVARTLYPVFGSLETMYVPGNDISRAIEQALTAYRGDKEEFERGVKQALADRAPEVDEVALTGDGEFEIDKLTAVVAARLNVPALRLEGDGFGTNEVVSLVSAASGLTTLILVNTRVEDLAEVLSTVPTLTRLEVRGNVLDADELIPALETDCALQSLEMLVLEYRGPMDRVSDALAAYFMNAQRLRNVELWLSQGDIDYFDTPQRFLNAIGVSKTIAAFFCPGIYPDMSASFQDEFAAALKRNRAQLVGSYISRAKAAEMLHHGSVHGHRLTSAQRRYFGAIAGGAHLRENK